jgi:hypothetical protein
VLEPSDIDGVGGLTKRTNSWTSQDKVWFYVPATRRVRQASAASRSEPVAGMDIFADDINCYAGKVEYYKWKVVGETNILAPVLQPDPLVPTSVSKSRSEVNIPYFKGAYETPGAKGAPWLIVENLKLIPRPVWILEGEVERPVLQLRQGDHVHGQGHVPDLLEARAQSRRRVLLQRHVRLPLVEDRRRLLLAVAPNLVVGVNDKTNRAALGGRYSSQFFESQWPEDYFSLRTLTHLSD